MPLSPPPTHKKDMDMRASDLIKEIQSKMDEYGDLPVIFDGRICDVNVGSVEVYDDEGNSPKGEKVPFEIYLHSGDRAKRD